MFDWDKLRIAAVFKISMDKNTKCIILVSTNTYDMDINNPDIEVIIQLNLLISIDIIIQYIDQAKRKS